MVYRETCLSIFYGSGGITRSYSTGNLRVQPKSFLEGIAELVLFLSRCIFAKGLHGNEISTGSDERAVGADLQNSQETTKRRNISLKPILSKEWVEDKSASSLESYTIQRDTEEDPLPALAEMLGKRKLILEGKLPVELLRRDDTLTSWIESAAADHGTDEGILSHHKKFLADSNKLLLHAFDVLQEKRPVAYQTLFKSGRLIEQLVYEALTCVRADFLALCTRNILVTK